MREFMLPVAMPVCSNCGKLDWVAGHFGDQVGTLVRCEACKQVYAPRTSVVLTATIEPVAQC